MTVLKVFFMNSRLFWSPDNIFPFIIISSLSLYFNTPLKTVSSTSILEHAQAVKFTMSLMTPWYLHTKTASLVVGFIFTVNDESVWLCRWQTIAIHNTNHLPSISSMPQHHPNYFIPKPFHHLTSRDLCSRHNLISNAFTTSSHKHFLSTVS